jgi:hypothetical protein
MGGMKTMKKLFTGILMAAVVAGVGFGVAQSAE